MLYSGITERIRRTYGAGAVNGLLVHPETNAQLESFLSSPSHALMLTGRAGSGKAAIAEAAVQQLLGGPISEHPYVFRIQPIKQTITIEQIRELQNFIKLKTTGRNTLRRAIIIDNAHLMGVEAQNALLKTLEEPPEDTLIILTAEQDVRLKPTIYSRVQRIHVRPLAKQHTSGLLDKYPEASLDKAYVLSGGQSALMQALLDEQQEHELVQAIETAKKILTASIFERLVLLEQLVKAKTEINILLSALKRVANAAVRNAVKNDNDAHRVRWQQTIRSIHKAEKQLAMNGQAKLVLTNLFLSM